MPLPERLQYGRCIMLSKAAVRAERDKELVMKAKKSEVPTAEFRIWCEACCIRIAPHEERTIAGGKIYHLHCYSKLPSANVVSRTASRALTITGSLLP